MESLTQCPHPPQCFSDSNASNTIRFVRYSPYRSSSLRRTMGNASMISTPRARGHRGERRARPARRFWSQKTYLPSRYTTASS
jgi:hypothetical protein